MAGQSVFRKTCSLITGGRWFFNNRLSLVQTQSALFSKTTDESKEKLQIPEKPKRPLTPFFRYVSEHRSELVKTNPHMKATDLIKKCSEEWRNSDDTIKKKYEEDYRNDMKQYAAQYLDYASRLSEEQKQAIKEASREKRENRSKRLLKKKIKANNKPKRPLAPYMQFIKVQTHSRELKFPEALKTLAAEWKVLPDSEKAKYKEMFEQDSKVFNQELLRWEQKMVKEGNADIVRKSTLENLDISQKKQLEKEKPKKMKRQVTVEKEKTAKTGKKE